jgi:hypothetical protein
VHKQHGTCFFIEVFYNNKFVVEAAPAAAIAAACQLAKGVGYFRLW